MDRHLADTSRALDVLHIPGAPAFLIDGEAQNPIHLHDVGKVELTNLFKPEYNAINGAQKRDGTPSVA